MEKKQDHKTWKQGLKSAFFEPQGTGSHKGYTVDCLNRGVKALYQVQSFKI